VFRIWQVSGRNDIDYDERVAIDMEYRQPNILGDKSLSNCFVMVFKRGLYSFHY
jgi:lipopolysaccharide/colanic/teichoic acid biosynthesis glycosyltransferase